MSNSKYKGLQCHDDRLPTTQEVGIQRCLAFAGIHDVEFATWINEAFDVDTSTPSVVSLEGAEGTWYTSGGLLYGVGGGAAQWYKVRYRTATSVGFVASFTKTGDRGAFLFNCDSAYDGYMIWWTSTAVGVSQLDLGVETVLVSLPMAETGAAAVTVAVWPRRYSSIDTIDDASVMLWFDDKHLLTHTMEYDEDHGGALLGFAVYGSDTITFNGLVVPQLHQLIEWASVDPGEAVSAGYGRVAGHDKIRAQARYDGSVKVWREAGTDSDWTVPSDRPVTVSESLQIYPPTHLRLVGALHEIENFRTSEATQGHIFAVESDPNALSESETSARASRRHKQVYEDAHAYTFNMAPNPVLEPEDIITYGSTNWRVSVISYRVARENDIVYVLRSILQTRECLNA